VTADAAASGWSAILLDIEGTTTPITFVHQILFPYARQRLGAFASAHRRDPAVVEAVARLRREHAADTGAGADPPAWLDERDQAGLVAYLEWLMDRDRKSPGLKALQGLIWEEGYSRGELRGLVFDEVPGAMRRWRAEGKKIAIYSSGSVLAQRRLFQTTPDGDLTTIIDGFFDTSVGAKVDRESYERIAAALGTAPGRILFVSDVTAELSAARQVGFQVRLATRPGNALQRDAPEYVAVTGLAEI
jgi:enolase-phosphatase E1